MPSSEPNPFSGARFAALVGISAVLFFLSLLPTELIPEIPVDTDFKAFFVPLLLVALLPVGRPTVAVALGVALGEGLRDLMEGYEIDDPLGFVAYIVAFILAGYVIGVRPLNRGVLFLGAVLCAAIQACIEAASFIIIGGEGLSVALTSAIGNTITHGVVMGAVPLLFLVPTLHGRFERHLGFAPKGTPEPRQTLRRMAAEAAGPASRPAPRPTVDADRPDALVTVDDLWFRHPGTERPALRGVNLRIDGGEVLGLIAPDGDGASDLCLCVAGVAPRDTGGDIRGRIMVAGHDPQTTDPADTAARVGLVTARASALLTQVRPVDEVASVLMNRGQPVEPARHTARGLLARVGLPDALLDRRIWELSEGEQRLVVLAAALAGDPALLILDRLVGGLDATGRRNLRRIIEGLPHDKAVLLVDDDPDRLAELTDRVAVMVEGRIVGSGPTAEILSDRPLLAQTGVARPEVREPGAADPARAPVPAAGREVPALTMRRVAYGYDDGPLALDGVDLEMRSGELTLVLGANGAGKTTLARVVAGLLKPQAGRVALAGRDAANLSFADRMLEVGMVFADPDQSISERTVLTEIAFPLRRAGAASDDAMRKARETARRVGLPDDQLDCDPTVLPMGWRKRVAIAGALVRGPGLLVLDEPALGLDASGRRGLVGLLRRLKAEGVAVLVLDHHPDPLVVAADRVALLAGGRIQGVGDPATLCAPPAGTGIAEARRA